MTGSAWDSLLTRARARRGRLCGDEPDFAPEPAPALELVIRIMINRSGFPAFLGSSSLEYLFRSSIDVAYWAETLALESGTLRDRLRADDALSSCIRVAVRIVAQPYSRDQEGP
jgi:hypothetical protein